MTHNHHRPDQTETAMGDAWEALVLGQPTDDPETMAVVREVLEDLAALEQGPPLSFAHRARLWQEVLAAAATVHPPVTLPASYPASPNGYRPEMTLPVAPLPTRSSRLVTSLSMTVLVVLGLAVVLLVNMGVLQPGAIRVGDLTILPATADEAPALIPAIDGTPTSRPSTPQTGTTDTLLDTKVTALPGGRLRVAVDRWTLQPSPSAVTLPAYEGVVVLTVEIGQLTVTVDGTDHQLAGGEALDVTNAEFAFHNSGPAAATAYVVYAIPQFSAEVGHGADQIWLSGDPLVHTHDVVISSAAETFPAGSGRLILERVALPPGSALPAETASPWVWTRAGAGILGLSLKGESLPSGWESGDEREFPPHFQNLLPVVAPGTTMVMRNAGDDLLVLYRLTLAPSGVGELSS
jgi:hypothetical protein